MFQSTRPHGARPSNHCVDGFDWSFNPRARMGRDARRALVNLCRVSIHAPAWGATSAIPRRFADCYRFQSTRPHGARPNCRRSSSEMVLVSIHAPAWGATSQSMDFVARHVVSIHAPAWGATLAIAEDTAGGPFQSTRPHGARHAPDYIKTILEFQSTRPHGARLGFLYHRRQRMMFQSTRPHGARLGDGEHRSDLSSFNPRARMGRDHLWSNSLLDRSSFNPRARMGRDI